MNKYIIGLFIILFLFSCSTKKKTIKKYNNFIATELPGNSLSSKKIIVIIPNQGCGGCITIAENFYNEFRSRDDILFIFTNIISAKMLKYKININTDNTIIDIANKFQKCIPLRSKIYPCIFYLQNGKISALFYQSPEEAGFNIAKQLINKKL